MKGRIDRRDRARVLYALRGYEMECERVHKRLCERGRERVYGRVSLFAVV